MLDLASSKNSGGAEESEMRVLMAEAVNSDNFITFKKAVTNNCNGTFIGKMSNGLKLTSFFKK
jgi:hypothetical protein